MTNPLIWAILILIVGLMLLIAELFLPSGGVLGILAAAALIGSVLLAFSSSSQAGMTFMAVLAVAIPAVIGFGLQLWPKTPLGRRMLLARPKPEEFDPQDRYDHELSKLVGKVGRTITQLRPAGMTDLEGRRVDTIAEGMIIEAGTLVRVIGVQGRRVLVRKIKMDDPETLGPLA